VNLSDFILHQSRMSAPTAAIYSPGPAERLISYGRLGQSVESIAQAASARALAPGSLAAIVIGDPVLHAAAVFGLMRAGIVTVSMNDAADAAAIAADTVLADVPVRHPGARVLPFDESWLQHDRRGTGAHVWRDDAVCRLARSERHPQQMVALTPGLLMRRATQTQSAFGPRWASASQIYSTFKLSDALGFELLLGNLMRGGLIVLPHGAHSVPNFFERFGIQAAIGAVDHWEPLLQSLGQDDSQQYGLDVAVSVGVTDPEMSRQARRRISPSLMAAVYTPETGFVAAAPLHHLESIPGAAGYLLPGVRVSEPGRVDTAVLKSHCCADAYWPMPATRKANGWALTGIKQLTSDGLLILEQDFSVENPSHT
jgi:hypothetical protein